MPPTRNTHADYILSQIRSCLDTAISQPGLMKASVYQTEGYLRGLQGLPWEAPTTREPSREDAAASFLHDIRHGSVALRGRLKKHTDACQEAFQLGFGEAFPEARGKQFFNAISKLWVRWLAALLYTGDPQEFSKETGFKSGELLKREYEEGLAGNLAVFLLDKRLHLDGARNFLNMRGWLLGTIEHLRRSPVSSNRECAEILNSNLSSIILRAQHNAGPGYGAEVVGKLSQMLKDLDLAIRNLSSVEPEASFYLQRNRSTIITKALHSGNLDYGSEISENLPGAIKDLDRRIENLDGVSPDAAQTLRDNKRRVIYRALTNGRLD